MKLDWDLVIYSDYKFLIRRIFSYAILSTLFF